MQRDDARVEPTRRRRRRRCRARGASRAQRARRRRRGARASSLPSCPRGAPRACRARRSAGVDDRDAVAEPLGLVEVVRREQDRDLVRGRAGPRSRRAARGGCAGRARRSARRGRAHAARRAAPARSRAAAAGRRCSVPTVRPSRSVMPSASATSAPCALSPRPRSTPHRRACTSRFRWPVSARSTTGSWKTTLLMRRAASGSAATSKPSRRRRAARSERAWS